MKLAGQFAFLKMYSTRCAQDTANEGMSYNSLVGGVSRGPGRNGPLR